MLTVGVDRQAVVWDYSKGRRICVLEDRVTGGDAKLHPSGRTVAIIDEVEGVCVADAIDGRRLSTLCEDCRGAYDGCLFASESI